MSLSLKSRDEYQLGPSKFAQLATPINELSVAVAVDHCAVDPAEDVTAKKGNHCAKASCKKGLRACASPSFARHRAEVESRSTGPLP